MKHHHEDYNTVVLNLYCLEKGYTLGFNVKSVGVDNANDETPLSYNDLIEMNRTETKSLSYEENELLFYINNGEIPPILIDLIDHLNVKLVIISDLSVINKIKFVLF